MRGAESHRDRLQTSEEETLLEVLGPVRVTMRLVPSVRKSRSAVTAAAAGVQGEGAGRDCSAERCGK